MPLFRITEVRCIRNTYIVEAADEAEARLADPDLWEGPFGDDWADRITDIEELEEDDIDDIV